jgi:hypothetical protein
MSTSSSVSSTSGSGSGGSTRRPPLRKQSSQAVLIHSYKPVTVTDTRRQIEDYLRDLVINNDHISLMERRDGGD